MFITADFPSHKIEIVHAKVGRMNNQNTWNRPSLGSLKCTEVMQELLC